MTTKKTAPGAFPWQHLPTPGKIYGTATVGDRGQISIPAEARKLLDLNSGDKVVVFGNRLNGSLVLLKADIFKDFAGFFMTKLNKLGGHAQEFFEQFTTETGDESDEEDAADEEDDEAPAHTGAR